MTRYVHLMSIWKTKVITTRETMWRLASFNTHIRVLIMLSQRINRTAWWYLMFADYMSCLANCSDVRSNLSPDLDQFEFLNMVLWTWWGVHSRTQKLGTQMLLSSEDLKTDKFVWEKLYCYCEWICQLRASSPFETVILLATGLGWIG